MHEGRYYRPSGAVPFAGTLLMLLCGGAAAAALAFVYGLASAYNPYIYLTFIATVLFGLGMGAAVVFGAMAGRVRNRGFTILVAACVGLLGLYMAWVFFISYIYQRIGVEWPFDFDPAAVFREIRLFGENGLRIIFGWMPQGWTLYAFWLTEAAIIVGGTVIVAAAPRKPFCEVCRLWTEEEKPARPLALTDPDGLRAALEQEQYEVLDELRDAELTPENCLRVTLYTCPQCSESNFLTVAHVRQTTDGQGTVHTQSTDLVPRLCVPESLIEHLRDSLKEPVVTFAVPPAAAGAAAIETGSEETESLADVSQDDATSAEPPR